MSIEIKMKILPLSKNNYCRTSKTNLKNNSNFTKPQILNKNNQISFRANFDLAYKTEANMLRLESTRNQQIAQKQVNKAKQIYSRRQGILDEAQDVLQQAIQYQSELFEMIQFSDDGNNFNLMYNPNEGIEIKHTHDYQAYQITQQISDDKIKRTQVGADGVMVYIDDLKTKTTDAFVYSVPDFEIDYCSKDVDFNSSSLYSKKRFAFENNELTTYDEDVTFYFLYKTGQKASISYVFDKNELTECNVGIKQDEKYLNISQVYYFSPDGKLDQSCLDAVCDMNNNESFTGVELQYNQNQELDVCIKNEHINVYNRKNCDKIFEYKDGKLEEILIGAYIKAPGMMDAKRVYQYENSIPKCALLNLQNSGIDYVCKQKIEF